MVLAQWTATQTTTASGLPSDFDTYGSTLGRRLSSGGGLTTGSTTRTIPLIKPGTVYTPRRTQVDLRVSKNVHMGGAKRLQVMADIFNLFNSNAAVGATSNAGEPPAAIITTYAPGSTTWLKPLNILQARYVKFGVQLTF
jgi:hypothetical protein